MDKYRKEDNCICSYGYDHNDGGKFYLSCLNSQNNFTISLQLIYQNCYNSI